MSKANEPIVNVNDITRISLGTAIRGDIISSSDIRVDGKIDGTVFSNGRIVVGEKAALSGNLLCTNLDLWGKVNGDIYVKDTLSIKSTCEIDGNINVRRLQVEMGAQINGTCHMMTEQDYEKKAATIVKKVPAPKAEKVEKTAKSEDSKLDL